MITVVIPVYNRKDVIGRCIESCAYISDHLSRIVVVDGGSSDGTLDIVSEICTRSLYFKELVVLVSGPDDGLYDAMNKGIDCAIGSYVIFLGADDFFLSFAGKNIDSLNLECSNGKSVYLMGSLLLKSQIVQLRPTAQSFEHLLGFYFPLLAMPSCHQGMIFPIDVIQDCKFDLTIGPYADFAHIYRLRKRGVKCVNMKSAVIVAFSLDDGGISSKSPFIAKAVSKYRGLKNSQASALELFLFLVYASIFFAIYKCHRVARLIISQRFVVRSV